MFHCNIKNINRKSGSGNICASVAYRTGKNLLSNDDKLLKHPHRNKNDIEHTEILNWNKSRQDLWNSVEKKDNRKNSNLAREILVAVPKELNQSERIRLVRDYSEKISERYKVAVDFSLHKEKKDNGNFHAHILITTREVLENGELGKKTRILDDKKTGSKEFKWIREIWAETANAHLEKIGSEKIISASKSENDVKGIHHGHNKYLKIENDIRQEVISAEKELIEIDKQEKNKNERIGRINNTLGISLQNAEYSIDRIGKKINERRRREKFYSISLGKIERLRELHQANFRALQEIYHRVFECTIGKINQSAAERNKRNFTDCKNIRFKAHGVRKNNEQFSEAGRRIRKTLSRINSECRSNRERNSVFDQLHKKKLDAEIKVGALRSSVNKKGFNNFLNNIFGLNHFEKKDLKEAELELGVIKKKMNTLANVGQKLEKASARRKNQLFSGISKKQVKKIKKDPAGFKIKF